MRLSEIFVRVETARSAVSAQHPEPSEPHSHEEPITSTDNLEKFERLAKLREQGVISEAEMQQLKTELLGSN